MALGVPLSWKKTHLAEVNTWLGFVIHPNIPQVQMIATKHTLVLEVLELLIQNTAMTTKSIESLGRLQWAIAVCPLTKGLLQPSWAWKMGLLALLMKELFTIPYQQLSPYLPKSQWWGCSDASAAATGEAYMGGWLSDSQSPAKSPYWRSPLLERQYPQTRPHTDQTPEAHTRVSKALPAPVEGTVKSLTAQHSGYTQQGPRHTGAAGPECDRFTQCTQDPPAGDEKITTSFTRETQSKQRPSCPFLSLAL